MDPYATHLPLLSYLLTHFGYYQYVEIGAGFYSTPLILAKGGQSFESDPLFRDRLNKLGYPVKPIEALLPSLGRHYSVIFIDSHPASSRLDFYNQLKERGVTADFWVFHDTNPDWEWEYKTNEIAKDFKHRFDYTKLYPHTTVLSREPLDFLKVLA